MKHNFQLDSNPDGIEAKAQEFGELLEKVAAELPEGDEVVAQIIQPELVDLVIEVKPGHSKEEIAEALVQGHQDQLAAVAAVRPKAVEVAPELSVEEGEPSVANPESVQVDPTEPEVEGEPEVSEDAGEEKKSRKKK